jgi:hypothetical protein
MNGGPVKGILKALHTSGFYDPDGVLPAFEVDLDE